MTCEPTTPTSTPAGNAAEGLAERDRRAIMIEGGCDTGKQIVGDCVLAPTAPGRANNQRLRRLLRNGPDRVQEKTQGVDLAWRRGPGGVEPQAGHGIGSGLIALPK